MAVIETFNWFNVKSEKQEILQNYHTVRRRLEYYIQVFNVEAAAVNGGGCVYFYVWRPLFCKTKCWWQRQPQKGHHRPRRRLSWQPE